MKLTRVTLGNATNGTWYAYLTFIIKLIKQNESVKTLLAALLTMLEKIHSDASGSLEVMRASQLSRDIEDADMLRDRMVGGLNNYVRSFAFDIDPAKRRAAENILLVIDHYGAIAQASQDDESTMIISFVKELETTCVADMEVIALEERKEQLVQANTRFIDLRDQRTIEIGSKPTLRMVDVRREGNRVIRMLYSHIEMLLISAPTEVLTQFAGELNAESQRINANMNRKGERDSEVAR
jgi:hypothetical protein